MLATSPQNVRASTWMEEGNFFVYNTTENITFPEESEVFFEINITILDVTANNVTLRYHSYNPIDMYPSHNLTDTYNKTTRESEKVPGYYAWLWINSSDLTNGTVLVEDHITSVGNGTPSLELLLWSDVFGNSTEYYFRKSDLVFDHAVDHRINATLEFNGTTEYTTYGQGRSGSNGGSSESKKRPSPSDTGPPGGMRSVYTILPPWSDCEPIKDDYEEGSGDASSEILCNAWGRYETYATWAHTPLHGEAGAEGYVGWNDEDPYGFSPPESRTYWVVFSFRVNSGYIWTKAMALSFQGIRLGVSAAYNSVNFGGYIQDPASVPNVFYEVRELDHCYSDSSSSIFWPDECRIDWWQDLLFVSSMVYLDSHKTYYYGAWYYNLNVAWANGAAYAIAQSDLWGFWYALELYY